MKQLNFLSKTRWLLVPLMLITLGIGQMWAVDPVSTLTFTAACGGSGTADDDAYWTVSSDAEESTYDGTKGIHYGTGKVAVSYLQLATSNIEGTITQVVVRAAGASGTSGKVSVKVGTTDFEIENTDDTEASITSSAADYTFTGSATGTITVRLSQSSAKIALYCKSIAVTYSTKATVTYNANGATSGDVPTDATQYNPNASVTVKGNTGNLERTGCTFAGWNTAADGSGTTYENGTDHQSFTISTNTTLYAKWTATVTWKANNVKVKEETIVVPAAGKTVTLPTDGEIGSNKCGDRIMGWTESETHKANTAPADLFTAAPTVQGSKTYYAVFADYAE